MLVIAIINDILRSIDMSNKSVSDMNVSITARLIAYTDMPLDSSIIKSDDYPTRVKLSNIKLAIRLDVCVPLAQMCQDGAVSDQRVVQVLKHAVKHNLRALHVVLANLDYTYEDLAEVKAYAVSRSETNSVSALDEVMSMYVDRRAYAMLDSEYSSIEPVPLTDNSISKVLEIESGLITSGEYIDGDKVIVVVYRDRGDCSEITTHSNFVDAGDELGLLRAAYLAIDGECGQDLSGRTVETPLSLSIKHGIDLE